MALNVSFNIENRPTMITAPEFTSTAAVSRMYCVVIGFWLVCRDWKFGNETPCAPLYSIRMPQIAFSSSTPLPVRLMVA